MMNFASDEEKRAYFRRLGSRGDKQTVARHGKQHMSRIGKRGFQVTTEKYFPNEQAHKRFLAVMGAHVYWKFTGMPMKYSLSGHPIFPEEMPPHPAHDDYTPF